MHEGWWRRPVAAIEAGRLNLKSLKTARVWLPRTLGAALAVTIVVAMTVHTAEPSPSDGKQVGEFVKAVCASFAGAIFAFLFAQSRDRASRKDDHRAAGNVATITVTKQWNDFKGAMDSIEVERALGVNALGQPLLPTWLRLRMPYAPSLYSADLKQKVHDIAFLAEYSSGPEAMTALINADMKYHYFFALLTEHAEQAKLLQEKFQQAGFSQPLTAPLAQIAQASGPVLVGSMGSLIDMIFTIIDSDKHLFLEAASSLESVLVAAFPGEKVLKLRPR